MAGPSVQSGGAAAAWCSAAATLLCLASGATATNSTVCPDGEEPVTQTIVNPATRVPYCVHDYDADTGGRYCREASPDTHDRVLDIRGGNINSRGPDPHGQCAKLCMAKGMHGTAGLEYGNQCWCSNKTGLLGIPGNVSDCNSTAHGMCSPGVWCGGHCRLTEFAIVCKAPAAAPMSGGTIFLICFAVVGVTYMVAGAVVNHRRGEAGLDLVPNRDFWRATFELIREGCAFSALTCVGGTKRAFKVGHETYARYEQL